MNHTSSETMGGVEPEPEQPNNDGQCKCKFYMERQQDGTYRRRMIPCYQKYCKYRNRHNHGKPWSQVVRDVRDAQGEKKDQA